MSDNVNKTGLISINTSYFLRGIAILMVIFSHFFEWGEQFVANAKVAHFIASLGDWGVGIFFLLSGYALYKGYGNKKTDKIYLIKRFKNMYFPYIIIALAIALYGNAITGYKDIIKLLYGDGYWFITVILIIYLAFYLIGKLPGKYRVFILTVFIIDMSIWFYIRGYQDFWYSANWAFALGMIIAKYENRLAFVRNGFSINIKDYVFTFMGRLTIYIYVLHTFIYYRVMSIEGISNINWYVKILITTVVSVMISFVLEKILMNKFLWNRLLGKAK